MSEGEHRSVQYRRKAIPLGLARGILGGQQRRMYASFARLLEPGPEMRVLDLGVNGSLERPEQYFFEHAYPWPQNVVACGLEPGDAFSRCFPRTPYVQGRRAIGLPFQDDEFDVVFCNAVLEHVGDREAQRAFLAEALRVGRAAFVTTPNRWYPVELHTVLPLLHWLPTRAYRRLYRVLGFRFFSQEQNLNLLDRKSLLALVPGKVDAAIHEHRFLGFTSNLLLVVKRPKR